MYVSVTKLCGVIRTVGKVSLVCIVVTTVPEYGVDRSKLLGIIS